MMTKVIFRDPHIAGRDRWETNERAKASLSVEHSALRRVSARPLRLLLTTTGLVQSTPLRAHGYRTSVVAPRATTAVSPIAATFGPSGGMSKPCKLT